MIACTRIMGIMMIEGRAHFRRFQAELATRLGIGPMTADKSFRAGISHIDRRPERLACRAMCRLLQTAPQTRATRRLPGKKPQSTVSWDPIEKHHPESCSKSPDECLEDLASRVETHRRSIGEFRPSETRSLFLRTISTHVRCSY